MEQSSLRNISSAFGGINLIATQLQGFLERTQTFMITQKLEVLLAAVLKEILEGDQLPQHSEGKLQGQQDHIQVQEVLEVKHPIQG